jgi:N,N'-diacetyllegionaminate synthase
MNIPQSVQIIAEVGSVHDGSFGNALKLIEAAAKCKVDAVKFQTHIASAETLPDAPMPPYFKGEPRFEYFDRTGFSKAQWITIKKHCEDHGVRFLSSPFSIEAVELLEEIGADWYKIGSGEVTNIPMLDFIGSTGKHVILSSGMSTWEELDQAVEAIQKHHNNITILQCTSSYPCEYEDVGLNIMLEMKERYGLPVGLSDHTLTLYASLAAVTLGATIIERHFAYSRMMYGSDALHSLEPAEMTDLVQGVRAIETMQATKVDKDHIANRMGMMKDIFEKSVVSVVDIPADTRITADMIAVKKPGTGIPARRLDEIIGTTSVRSIPANTLLKEEDIRA